MEFTVRCFVGLVFLLFVCVCVCVCVVVVVVVVLLCLFNRSFKVRKIGQ